MAEGRTGRSHTLPLAEAARMIGIDEVALRSLVNAGYLKLAGPSEVGLADVKAFMGRNAEAGAGLSIGAAAERTNPQALLDALDSQVDELSRRAFDVFSRAMPEAVKWAPEQKKAFVSQAKGRLGAVLAVTGHGSEVDEALQQDLEDVGANAAWAGSSLPHLLIVLRISRDLLLEAALKEAHERQGRWDAILAAFMARMLSAMDRLTDALTRGYWSALLEQHEEHGKRLEALLEHAPYGVYEADFDGVIRYSNSAFATMVGRRGEDLYDIPLGEVIQPTEGSVGSLLSEPAGGIGQATLVITGADGRPSRLDVDVVVRREGEEVVGYAGILRDTTAASAPDLSILARHIYEMERSLQTLIEAGAFISRHADEMQGAQIDQAGRSVKRQAQRLLAILEELDKERKSISPPPGG